MMLNAYSIFDTKAVQWHSPFYLSTDAAAARALSDVVKDPNTLIGRHPSDHRLYCVGTWNDANGEFSPIIPARHVADAASFIPLMPDANQLALELDRAEQRANANGGAF